jgi:hypothetical protein
LARDRNVRHEQEEAILKFMLRTLIATALMVLAANVCLAATAGSSLTSKQLKAAIRQAQHPQAPKGRQLKWAPRNNAVRTATAVDTQKAGVAAAVVPMRNASIVNVTAAIPAVPADHAALRAPAFRVMPPPIAAANYGAVSGSSVKHSLSTLASVGGATTGKGTAIINGTSVVRPKQQH